jgi:mannose-6-phosphate isomerase-like protein (cupin superfamily)
VFDTSQLSDLPDLPDAIAPDGSEIRLLKSNTPGSSMVHALLRPGSVTRAVHHRTVEEAWNCVGGEGKLWRRNENGESEVHLAPGTSLDIPLGTHFQFRADGKSPLEIVITTTPPWPGDDEAVECARNKARWTLNL